MDWWNRHHQPGIWKIPLAGPPGTGKTSIIEAIAAEFARTKPRSIRRIILRNRKFR
ncbi:AAA family ATPase [Acidiphilium sp. PA]|uniref:AAA family ATPase n=1 Tax=Acidiphilium sp. PA TaxID=2871705 RepID=UPI0038D1C1B8